MPRKLIELVTCLRMLLQDANRNLGAGERRCPAQNVRTPVAEGGHDLLAAARLTADGLLGRLDADGFLPGRIEPGWRPAVD